MSSVSGFKHRIKMKGKRNSKKNKQKKREHQTFQAPQQYTKIHSTTVTHFHSYTQFSILYKNK